MAVRKTDAENTKKAAAKPAKTQQKNTGAARPAAVPPREQEVIPVEAKPSARTCPMVLDGITAPEKFSPRDCLSCDEFDCRFNAVEERSLALGGMRTFDPDDGDDGFGDDDDGFGGFGEGADADDSDDDYDDMR